MEQTPLPDFRTARLRAGEILAENNNRLKLMEGIVVCLMPVLLSILLGSLFAEILAVTAPPVAAKVSAVALFSAFLALFQLFLTLPLLVGLFGLAAGMADGDHISLADLFRPFSGGRAYRRALGLSFGFFWKAGLLVLAVWGTLAFFAAVGGGKLLPALLAGFLTVGEVIGWIVLTMRRFPVLALVLRGGLTPREARKTTAGMVRRARRGGLLWAVCFLPWVLFGLLSVGILLLADVVPRMLVSYFLFSQNLTDPAKSSEVTNHE